MRSWLAAAGLALMAGAALAQDPAVDGFTQRFISPCGQPWRAGPNDAYPLFAWFKATDGDNDGSIDLPEFRNDHAQWFDLLDRNHDGMLDPTEISFYEKRVAPDVLMGQLFAAGGRPNGGRLWGGELIRAQLSGGLGGLGNRGSYSPPTASGPPPDLGAERPQKQPLIGAAVFGLLNDAEPVTSADANLDGRVTKAEFLAAAERRFKRLDRNGDGKLTIEELPKPQAQVLAEADAKKRSKRR